MLDAIYDFKRVDPDWNATLRPSTIPVNCPGDAGCGKDGETIMSIRQSKIAFKGFVPTPKGELTHCWTSISSTSAAATRTRAC